jgi:phosphohistidine phosphatase
MDLILWRTAEAEENSQDLERKLTAKGKRQCERVASWLDHRLPTRFAVLCSPALRAQQTAQSLGIPVKPEGGLAPGAAPLEILRLAGWPDSKAPVIVVAHQPDLGGVLSVLLSESKGHWSIKKGGLWWLTNRVRGEAPQVVVRAVVSPELL